MTLHRISVEMNCKYFFLETRLKIVCVDGFYPGYQGSINLPFPHSIPYHYEIS